MPSTTAMQLISKIKSENRMTVEQLLDLRREFGGDMEICAAEADELFALNAVENKPEDWADYFVLMMTTYLVHQGQPEGHMNDAMASWLITRIDHDGVVETETELRLLMNILKVAEVPGERLEAYALKQVKEAVLNGRGAVGHDKLEPSVIGKAEIELLRRIFYSVGSAGGLGITRMEAEEILALNEATSGKDNDPEWQRFFVGAIANHLMMMAAPAPLTAEDIQRREAWLNADVDLKGFWAPLTPAAIFGAFADLFGRRQMADLPKSSILDLESHKEAVRISDTEAQWLINAIQKDGVIDANERALLDFIRAECPEIDEGLRPLLDAA